MLGYDETLYAQVLFWRIQSALSSRAADHSVDGTLGSSWLGGKMHTLTRNSYRANACAITYGSVSGASV